MNESENLSLKPPAHKPDVLLVDGASMMFRAYYALPQLTNNQGDPTGAIHGFLNAIRYLQKTFENTKVIITFDTPEPTFRHKIFPSYKSNRSAMPDDLRTQIEPIFACIRAMGLPLIRVPGYEADDIIATYARQAQEHNLHVVIVSGDKDLMQLVNDKVTMFEAIKRSTIDRTQVFEKFGVWPEQIHDLLCLTGDTVDNIPGVPKVGNKTAAKWLSHYGDLDTIIANADHISGKVGENLRAHLLQIQSNRKLVALDSNTPLTCHIHDIEILPVDGDALTLLLEKYSLRSHFDLVKKNIHPTKKNQTSHTHDTQTLTRPKVSIITTKEQLATWVKAIQHAGAFAFDCETTGLDYHKDIIVGIAISLPNNESAYAPCLHTTAKNQLDQTHLFAGLQPVFSNPNLRMIGQNLKFDLHMLLQIGIQPVCKIEDTMLQSYVLDSSAGRHNLSSLATRTFGYTPIEYTDLVGSGKQTISFRDVPLQQAADYAGEDAWLANKLHHAMLPKLAQNTQCKYIYDNIEIPLIQVLLAMESNGFLIDATLLQSYGDSLGETLHDITHKVWKIANKEFSLDSPKQLGEVLFEQLGLPIKHKTPKGEPSTSERVLQELAVDHQLPKHMLEYRGLQKLRSTYTYAFIEQIHPKTGRVHSSFHQAVVATGRLSSSNPNLQNLPIKTKEGQKIRQAFIAPEGKAIVCADYSQIELRIMAHISDDTRLIQAFTHGEDVHNTTASEVFSVLGQPTASQRRAAKAINFGLMYGMGAYGLARNLGISNNEAQEYIKRYFIRYPGVHEYMQSIRSQALAKGYVETLFGRRLYFPGITTKNHAQKKAAERAAINAPMQGSAADIIKLAMIAAHNKWKNSDCKMLLQVHDELVFEVPIHTLTQVKKDLSDIMENITKLKVPLVVEVGNGRNWLEAHA